MLVPLVNGALRDVLAFVWLAALSGYRSEFRVHVVDSDYEAVGHANVTVTSEQVSRTAVADASGTATFADLPEGRYDVKIGASGFKVWESREYEVGSSQSRPLQATLSVGQLGCPPSLLVEYDNAQPRTAPVRGAVVEADSLKGSKGAIIAFRLFDGSGPTTTIRSGKGGVFEVTDISAGRYSVKVTKEGFQETDVTLVVPAEDAAVVSIKMEPRDHVRLCL